MQAVEVPHANNVEAGSESPALHINDALFGEFLGSAGPGIRRQGVELLRDAERNPNAVIAWLLTLLVTQNEKNRECRCRQSGEPPFRPKPQAANRRGGSGEAWRKRLRLSHPASLACLLTSNLPAAPALLALPPTSMGTPPYSYVSLVVANFQFNSRIVTSHRSTPWPQTIRIPATDRSR